MNHGGKREGSGRKSKDEEHVLIELLKPYDSEVLEILMNCVKTKQPWAIKLFMSYRYGKPTESHEIKSTGDPIINVLNLGSGIDPNS